MNEKEHEEYRLDSTWAVDATLTPKNAINLFKQTIGWEMEICLNWDFLIEKAFCAIFFFHFDPTAY